MAQDRLGAGSPEKGDARSEAGMDRARRHGRRRYTPRLALAAYGHAEAAATRPAARAEPQRITG